jgi:hypothetical protein
MKLRRRRKVHTNGTRAALERDRRELNRVRAQWPKVLQLAAGLEEHVERNHLAEAIASLYRGDKK